MKTLVELRFIAETFVVEIFDRKSHNSLLLNSNIYLAGNLSGLFLTASLIRLVSTPLTQRDGSLQAECGDAMTSPIGRRAKPSVDPLSTPLALPLN